MAQETVLITGASSGIGYELAKCFARDGSDLILVARREKKLKQLAAELGEQHPIKVRVIAKDLTRADAASELTNELGADGVTVDVLVNNAGFGALGRFVESDLNRQLDMLRLNAEALTELSGLFLPGMLSRGGGGLLNVASTAAFQPGPNMAVYYATKAYVLYFTEALAEELRGGPIAISCLCPGPTRTGFADSAEVADTPLFQGSLMDAAEVARQGHAGFRSNKTIIIPGARNRLGALLTRFTPRAWARRVVKAIQPVS